ncbi:MAG TPA: SpoIIE family protein phosphatase [Rhodothermales bacterium]|nr:SpoIIE family protein phosphatase [Rhodothermales bacterium]
MPDSISRTQRTERFDLNALYETSRLLSASLDLEFVLNNLLLTAMSKLLVTRGAAFLFDPLHQAYRLASAKGIVDFDPDLLVHLDDMPTDRILQGEEVPQPLACHRIELVLPVRYGHREIGLIALSKNAIRQPFEKAELEFIQSLVNMSSAAVHNSLMVEELQQANRDLDGKVQQLNTLFDLSQEFNATVDRERLVKTLSFALMGQMLVGKYLFLLRRTVTVNGVPDGEELNVITSRGIQDAVLEREVVSELCGRTELLMLDGEVAPEWEGLKRRGLSVVIPLLQQGEPCGMLCLGPKLTGQPYGPDDIEFLYSLGNLALVSIQNSYLVEEQIERERLEEEMRLARSIQEKLLPQQLPELAGVDVATLALPSRLVGGDYFDVVKLEGPRMLVAVGDVTGKGVPASLLMANLQACLHMLLPMDLSLAEAAQHINRVICDNTTSDKFITFFFGFYNAELRSLTYVNAGHNPPMLVRADGTLELLETGGLLLGVMRGLPYEQGTVNLSPGDVLVLFTDGVTEAMSLENAEYGEERLEQVLVAHRHEPAHAILDTVYHDIRQFTSNRPMLSDDLTMVVLKMTE